MDEEDLKDYTPLIPKAILASGAGAIEWAKNMCQAVDNANHKRKVANKENQDLRFENKVLKAEIERLNRAIPHLSEKMCGGKKAYYTKAQVQAMVDKFGGRFYQCPTCACFHHTTKKTLIEKAAT